MTKNLQDKDEAQEPLDEKEQGEVLNFLFRDTPETNEKERTISLYGDLDEEYSSALVFAMLSLKNSGKREELKDPEDPECKEMIETYEPFKLIVSTHGGSAHEMFAIYDVMRMVKKDCDIETMGVGKVMSAGVLILSAGTPGKRKIGKNCRVMIHPVAAASMGDLNDIENETKEIKWLQKQYLNCLVENTKMTEKYIKKLFRKKINTYLSAEEALRLGIVDEIF
tara:strand:+ start:438 stop:1109 length:672 start_codon:yes stop_codon:yes gene_type:complete